MNSKDSRSGRNNYEHQRSRTYSGDERSSGYGNGGYRNRGMRSSYGGDDNRSNRHHPYKRPRLGNGMNQQQKEREDPEKLLLIQMKEVIVSVGDRVNFKDATVLKSNLEDLAETLGRDLHRYSDEIAQLMIACASQLSTKTPIYATLTAMLSTKDPKFATLVVKGIMLQFQEAIDVFFLSDAANPNSEQSATVAEKDGTNFFKLRMMVRFLGDLTTSCVISSEDYICLLDSLQSVCFCDPIDDAEEKAVASTGAQDFFACLVLEALVWNGSVLSRECKDELFSLINRCQEYVNFRCTDITNCAAKINLLWNDGDENEIKKKMEKCHRLNILWKLIPDLQNSEEPWKVPCISTLSELIPSIKTIEKVSISPPKLGSSFQLVDVPPQLHFGLFSEECGEHAAAIVALPSPVYFVARSYFIDIINAFHPKPIEAARQLIIACFSLNSTLNAIRDVSIKSEYLMVETLFLQVLQLPQSNFLRPYYDAILYNLVKKEPEMLSPPVGIIIELLYRRIPEMDLGVLDTFTLVFARFLSNFEYKWPWEHWRDVLEAQEDCPQRLFVSTVIERCVRFSYMSNIAKILPPSFHVLLPPLAERVDRYNLLTPQEESVPESDDPNHSRLREHCVTLIGKMKAKEDLTHWIDTCNLEKDDLVEVVMHCILMAGSATFSHMRLLLEQYRQILIDLEMEIELLNIISDVWMNSPQHTLITMNMFVGRGIVSEVAVTKWLFQDDVMQQFSWPHVWEVLKSTIKRSISSITVAKQNAEEDATTLTTLVTECENRQRDMFLSLFQGFHRVLTEHLDRCQEEGMDYKDNWYKSTIGRMKEYGRTYRRELDPVMDELSSNVFNSNVHVELQELFTMIRSC